MCLYFCKPELCFLPKLNSFHSKSLPTMLQKHQLACLSQTSLLCQLGCCWPFQGFCTAFRQQLISCRWFISYQSSQMKKKTPLKSREMILLVQGAWLLFLVLLSHCAFSGRKLLYQQNNRSHISMTFHFSALLINS